MPKVIGITGRAGSGKSLFGALLASELVNIGQTVIMDALALPVKQTVRELYGYYGGPKSPEARGTMQKFGDELAGDKELGLVALFLERNLATKGNWIIVSDIRRHAEMQWFADNGILFYVYGRTAKLDGSTGMHHTENITKNLLEVNYCVVPNTRDLEWLQEQARLYAEYLVQEPIQWARSLVDEIMEKRP